MMIIAVTQYKNNNYYNHYTVQLYLQLLNSSLYRYHIEVDKKIDNADTEQRSVNWSSYRYL
jgi:hypothetical protein